MGELPTGAQAGLGARLLSGSYYGQTVQIWSALFMAAILAALLLALVSLLERLTFKAMGGGHGLLLPARPPVYVLTGLAGMGVAFIAVFLAHGGGGMLLWLCALAAWLLLWLANQHWSTLPERAPTLLARGGGIGIPFLFGFLAALPVGGDLRWTEGSDRASAAALDDRRADRGFRSHPRRGFRGRR